MKTSIRKEKLPTSRIYQLYLEWEATPASQRQPKRLSEFGDMYDISPDHIVEFREKSTYNDDLMATTLALAGRNMPTIVTSLMEKLAREPKSQDLQSMIKIIKDYGQNSVGISEFDFKSQLSNTQMREMVRILEEELK